MSLLTEKQLKELSHRVVYGPGSVLDAIEQWNNEQQPAAFEPDWSKAPKYVVGAALNLAWLTENGSWAFGYQIAKYDRPAPVITPHPHAALIAKFAEVAARRHDPWVEFEYKNSISGNWEKTISSISFFHDTEYRYIGEGKQ